MKKYLFLSAILFSVAACNNDDKKIETSPETEKAKTDVINREDTTTGSGVLSGKFEIIDYKKDNTKIDLPKTSVFFTRKGDFIKADGTNLLYKIEGDSLTIMISGKEVITKSKIEFLSPDSSSFILINAAEKTEFTYKKIK